VAVTEQIVRKHYKNLNGDSGVRFYAAGRGFIDIWFADNRGYRYEERKPGALHVAAMKRRAEAGRGLATDINQHVREDYARML
jgi:hypothetical protein